MSHLPRRHRYCGLAAGAAMVVAATGLSATAPASAGPPDHAGRSPEHVVLIDWDGFDPAFLAMADTPNLDALAERGSLTTGSSTFQTVSNPARASMSTGAWPDTHNNAAYYFDGTVARGQERYLEAETIAEALAEEDRTVASVQWYMVQNHGTAYGDPEHLYVQPGGDFGDRVDVAIDILNERPVDSGGTEVTVPEIPDLLAVYASDLDALAHREGAESPNIGPLLEQMDADLGRLVQATKDVGIYGETAFILTSDHGMTSWNRTLLPHVLDAIGAAGYVPEVVTPGRSPAEGTDVVIVPNAVRYGDITLRGDAATEEGRNEVRAALESLSPTFISQVLDDADLGAMRASDKLGDLIAEAQPPYGFALSEPPEGEWRASHGSTQELDIPFLVSGAGFRRGVAPEAPNLVDVAPTIAALLGIDPPDDAEGRVLTEAMGPPSSPTAADASPGHGRGHGAGGGDADSFTVKRGGEPSVHDFSAEQAGEALLDLTVAAPGADWATVGAESGVVSVAVDGRPVTDVVVPSTDPLSRRVALGPVSAGSHQVSFAFGDAASSPAVDQVAISEAAVEVVTPEDSSFLALRHAPVLLGRSIAVTNTEGAGTSYDGPLQNAVTDTPLLAWHESRSGTTPGHRVLEYSVVWSNEDGGTNSPALMARWGRTTDIEWIYRVEVDGAGNAVPGTAVYQGPAHATVPFDGTREGDHPVLQTCTANNMVCDDVADAGMRFFLAADATRPPDRAREVLMDTNPWTYPVMASEMVREGRIESPSDPATPELGDQRAYLYVEVDKDTLPANLPAGPWVGVALEVTLGDGRTFRSDHAVPDWSIKRDVPAATTVELPVGTTEDDVVAVSAWRVPVGTDTGAAVQVTAINRAFLLDDDYRPQASFIAWTGDVTLTAGEPAATLWQR
jgi:arylsulfatase A-like enzyme